MNETIKAAFLAMNATSKSRAVLVEDIAAKCGMTCDQYLNETSYDVRCGDIQEVIHPTKDEVRVYLDM